MTNCSLCHTAMIDGRPVAGLGNRNLRLNAMNLAIMRIAARPDFNAATMIPAAEACAAERKVPWGMRAAYVTEVAIKVLKELAVRTPRPTLAGLNGVDAGPGRNTPIEFAKATSLYQSSRRSSASSCLPSGRTAFASHSATTARSRATWLMSWPLSSSTRRCLQPTSSSVKLAGRAFIEYLKVLQPPKYPKKIDAELAKKGRELFRENCSHARQRGPDHPVKYQEKIVELSEIGTDPDRLRSISDPLLEARRKSPFAKRVNNGEKRRLRALH